MNSSASTTSLWRQLPGRILAVVDRLKDAEIRCRPALELIDYYNHPDVFVYCDPPYPLSMRTYNLYEHEMTDEEHLALLHALDQYRGPAVLSGYACPLYDDQLTHWYHVTMPSLAEKGNRRTEVLWLNQKAAQRRQLNLFERRDTGYQ